MAGMKQDDRSFIEDPGAMMAEHPNMARWVQPVVITLGVWLATSSWVFDYRDSPMRVSDALTGVLMVVIASLALRFRKIAWISYGNALVGLWLILAPLFFWAPNAAIYMNDTLIGTLLIAFSFVIPMSMPMPGPDIPPGWSYNPSTWIQRAPIIALGLIGYFLARPMAGYQLGYVDSIWEPFFTGAAGNGTEAVLTSELSKAWPVSDAGLGAATYLIEVLSTFMGDQRRWRTMPWMVAIFGIAVVPLGVTSVVLVMMQPIVVGAWCTLCLITAAAMLLMIPLALDEVVAMIQFLNHSRKRGSSFWRTFIRGGTLPEATESPRDDRKPSWRAPAMLWGVTGAWNLWASVLLGVWLMFVPTLFGMSKQSAIADHCHLLGALAATVAMIAIAEVGRPARWLNVAIGAWLVVANWFLGDARALGHWSVAISGALLVAMSFPLGRIREQYGSYQPWVGWKPGRKEAPMAQEKKRAA